MMIRLAFIPRKKQVSLNIAGINFLKNSTNFVRQAENTTSATNRTDFM